MIMYMGEAAAVWGGCCCVFSPLTESISSPSHLISQCPYSFPALSPTFLLLSLIVVQKCKCNVSVCLCLFVSVFVDIDCLA